jgi:hypothetical protein
LGITSGSVLRSVDNAFLIEKDFGGAMGFSVLLSIFVEADEEVIEVTITSGKFSSITEISNPTGSSVSSFFFQRYKA